MGGLNPAYPFVKACLMAGKHVVTSNKALVAAHGTELLAIAREHQVNFLFEASVGGGIPIIRPLYRCLKGEVIEEITGILNGTTNYILTRMDPVSYTHLDVYKRQPTACAFSGCICSGACCTGRLIFIIGITEQKASGTLSDIISCLLYTSKKY